MSGRWKSYLETAWISNRCFSCKLCLWFDRGLDIQHTKSYSFCSHRKFAKATFFLTYTNYIKDSLRAKQQSQSISIIKTVS